METQNNSPEPKNDKQFVVWCILGVVSVVGAVAKVAISAIKDVYNSGNDLNNVE